MAFFESYYIFNAIYNSLNLSCKKPCFFCFV